MSDPEMHAAPHTAEDAARLDMSDHLGMRLFEAAAMLTFFAFEGLLGLDVWRGFFALNAAEHAGWLIPLAFIGGYLTSDFVSGLVHFLADNFGSSDKPLIGPFLIRPFREHHIDPEAITRHGFLEINGANCAISLPILVATYYLVPVESSLWTLAFAAYIGLFLFGIFLTNQFHSWAHMENPPRVIRLLHRSGLILAPDHHRRHHTPPFNTYYCITSGWLNPILARARLWERIYEPLRRVTEPIFGVADEVGGIDHKQYRPYG